MRAGPLLATTVAIGGAPVAALLALVLTGAAALWPSLVAIAVVLVAAVLLAVLWLWDMDRLAETLRQATAERSMALAHAAGAPWLPPVEAASRDIERLARTLAARAAQIGQLLRATETIIDRLPDPLLVLGLDRGVRRANDAARAATSRRCCATPTCAPRSTGRWPPPPMATRRRPPN
jgi:two-component system phosphate regulon sensor histidine kinase PhoR